jgi:hypothetical protein
MVMQELDEDTSKGTPYHVDESWFEENGFSFSDFAQARMCESCVTRLGEEIEERYTVFDKKSGRASFDFRKVKYGDSPARVIRDCCSKKKDYITPDMPTLEAIFRVYLANGNVPMPLAHVREQLAEWCPGGGCQWLLLPMEALERLVQNDRFYGIRPHLIATAA